MNMPNMDVIKSLNIEELFAAADAERHAAVDARRRRGLVRYDPHRLVIRLMGYYEVDLEGCKCPKDLLDWIWHLTDSKVWFTPQVLADFLEEFKVACADRHVNRYAENWDWGPCPACQQGRDE
jgi:hypothetical protein